MQSEVEKNEYIRKVEKVSIFYFLDLRLALTLKLVPGIGSNRVL